MISNFNCIPSEVVGTIFSLLPQKSMAYLPTTCKYFRRVCVWIHSNDQKARSTLVSNILSSATLNVLTNQLKKDIKYPIHLRVCNLEERIPLLQQISKTNLEVTTLQITDSAEQKEVPALFTLFKNVDTLYLSECAQFPSMQYPPKIKKLFLRNISLTSEMLPLIAACTQLQKLFIQPVAGSSLPRKELIELQTTNNLEITVLDNKYKTTMNEYHDLLWEPGLGGFGMLQPSVAKIRQFWNNQVETKWISHTEKLEVFINTLFFMTQMVHQFPFVRTELEGQVMTDLQKAADAKPQNARALLNLGILQFFLSPEKNIDSAEQLCNQALSIEPNNLRAKTLLMCIFDKKSQTDISHKDKTISLNKEIHSELFDSTPHTFFITWLANNNFQGVFAQTVEGGYHLNSARDMFSKVPQPVEQEEGQLMFNFLHLIDIARRKVGNIIVGSDCPKEYLEKDRQELTQWLQTCLLRYPAYAPFLRAVENMVGGDTNREWEKSFDPEELAILQQMVAPYPRQ